MAKKPWHTKVHKQKFKEKGKETNQTVLPDTCDPQRCVCFFLPPPEIFYARFLVYTMTAITWKVANESREVGPCKIQQGLSESHNAEYVKICCENAGWLDKIKDWWGMICNDIHNCVWDDVRVTFDPNRAAFHIKAGSFVKGKYRQMYDIIFSSYLKYFYGRGFALEANQKETVRKNLPIPNSGLVDLELSSLIPYIWALYNLSNKVEVARIATGMGERTFKLLLADLGDRGLGLREALEVLYNISVERRGTIRVSPIPSLREVLRKISEIGMDINFWIHKLLIAYILDRLLLDEGIELVNRWPSVAIVSHIDRESRTIDFTIIDSDELIVTYHSILSVAEQLSTSASKVLRFLITLPKCIVNNFDDKEIVPILSKLTPLYESFFQGSVDRDLLYQVLRLVYSNDKLPDWCKSLL